jgi:hypothetical protein
MKFVPTAIFVNQGATEPSTTSAAPHLGNVVVDEYESQRGTNFFGEFSSQQQPSRRLPLVWHHLRKPMCRGIDKTQQAILEQLSAGHLAVNELAERLDASDGQFRSAVQALADRGLVNLYKVTHQLPDGRFAPVTLFAEKPSHWRS